MGGIIKLLFGGGAKPQGPSAAELGLQRDRAKAAFDEKADADKTAALSVRAARRQTALSFRDERKKQTLGG